jgi:hypothetical protein
MRFHFLPLVLVLVQAPRLAGQDPPPPASLAVSGNGLSRVLVDEPGDGSVQVLAPGYKARFCADGVEFIPFYGATAPRNFPLSFRLRSVRRGATELPFAAAARPTVEGLRVTFERGSVREVWDLRDREVEQRFVVAAGPARGELSVRIDVATGAACDDVADGLSFAHAGLGAVHGRSAPVPVLACVPEETPRGRDADRDTPDRHAGQSWSCTSPSNTATGSRSSIGA